MLKKYIIANELENTTLYIIKITRSHDAICVRRRRIVTEAEPGKKPKHLNVSTT